MSKQTIGILAMICFAISFALFTWLFIRIMRQNKRRHEREQKFYDAMAKFYDSKINQILLLIFAFTLLNNTSFGQEKADTTKIFNDTFLHNNSIFVDHSKLPPNDTIAGTAMYIIVKTYNGIKISDARYEYVYVVRKYVWAYHPDTIIMNEQPYPEVVCYLYQDKKTKFLYNVLMFFEDKLPSK